MAIVLVLAMPAVAGAETECTPGDDWGTLDEAAAQEILELTNEHRAGVGSPVLTISPTLQKAARWKALHLARFDYATHDDPAPPIARTWDRRFRDCGYTAFPIGENLAFGDPTAEDAISSWLASPGHRGNIEDVGYRAIGIGAAVAADGSRFWVQTFGGEVDGSPNNPPTAFDDQVETAEDTGITVPVTANDTDPDGDVLTVIGVTDPASGTTKLVSGGIRYKPSLEFSGSDSFDYTISDGNGGTASATVTITVTFVDDPPVVTGERVKMKPRRTKTVDVLANDFDPEGDTIALVTLRGKRRFGWVKVDLQRGTITYRARRGTAGKVERIRYVVGDEHGNTSTGVLRIKIRRP